MGANEACQGDPLIPIEKELSSIRYVKIPGLPSFTGMYIYIYIHVYIEHQLLIAPPPRY